MVICFFLFFAFSVERFANPKKLRYVTLVLRVHRAALTRQGAFPYMAIRLTFSFLRINIKLLDLKKGAI